MGNNPDRSFLDTIKNNVNLDVNNVKGGYKHNGVEYNIPAVTAGGGKIFISKDEHDKILDDKFDTGVNTKDYGILFRVAEKNLLKSTQIKDHTVPGGQVERYSKGSGYSQKIYNFGADGEGELKKISVWTPQSSLAYVAGLTEAAKMNQKFFILPLTPINEDSLQQKDKSVAIYFRELMLAKSLNWKPQEKGSRDKYLIGSAKVKKLKKVATKAEKGKIEKANKNAEKRNSRRNELLNEPLIVLEPPGKNLNHTLSDAMKDLQNNLMFSSKTTLEQMGVESYEKAAEYIRSPTKNFSEIMLNKKRAKEKPRVRTIVSPDNEEVTARDKRDKAREKMDKVLKKLKPETLDNFRNLVKVNETQSGPYNLRSRSQNKKNSNSMEF